MTDDEFMELYTALSEANQAIVIAMVDKLLTEQLEGREQVPA